MGDEEALDSLHGLFAEPEASTPPAPTFHEDTYERGGGRGSLTVQLVRSHALWGNHLWNGGRWLADYFDAFPGLVRDKSVLEFGAAAGLPSIVAALNGARRVVATDYPDAALVDSLRVNLDRCLPDAAARSRATALGFLWGSPVDGLLQLNGGRRFDVVVLCDLLFNHSEHGRLLQNCRDVLAPGGQAWCVFSHYVPRNAAKDLAFFDRVPEYGLAARKLLEYEFREALFPDDPGDPLVRRTCHVHLLTHSQPDA